MVTTNGSSKAQVGENQLRQIGRVLNDPKRPLKERFRALFTLKNLEGGVPYISEAFGDKSALLLHELAYCLGQTRDPKAIPTLVKVLADANMEAIARHEAGEALGAIGVLHQEARSVLEKHKNDANPVIAETCQLALRRIEFIHSAAYKESDLGNCNYSSIDPTPPFEKDSKTIEELREILIDPKNSLWERYRAMFSLRNLGSPGAIKILGEALFCPSSALFRHEVAFVFGQLQSIESIPYLTKCLENTAELAMVRHECAEALGSIATDDCMELLKKYLTDPEDVVRESCEVALDMCEYENSAEFQYADTLQKMRQVHNNCRNGFYAGTEIRRAEVPVEKVSWEVDFPEYQPTEYESEVLRNRPWSDPKITGVDSPMKFNEVDGEVNRKSHEGEYEVVNGLPRNPHGRTGIAGRGRLGRYGPNHAADPIVTRWQRDEQGKQVFDKTTLMPILEFVAIQRKDNGEWAIPGGMVDPGETVNLTLKREFLEEAMNSDTGLSENQRELVEKFFEKGETIYEGYVDDPRNTDNAWMETTAVNYHDERGHTVGNMKLSAGSDAGKVRWMPLSQELALYASHASFLEKVASKLQAHW
ncbi:deoxyhypusine hydroxylase [Galendromus occidentalis]|uniref:Deoxyhypusine hydroxylase n=1 Tax=Galendromus occidentalis TaxID=34638 RepID=A0AAJ7SF17_9ACAR|nr:deoxyhypusine hydroxylase [Galendromus occidentalis]